MLSTKTFRGSLKVVTESIPSSLRELPDIEAFIKVIAYVLYRVTGIVSMLDNVYDVERVDEEYISRLLDTLGVRYPTPHSVGEVRAILKYWGRINEERGTLNSLYQLTKVVGRSEVEIYNCSMEDLKKDAEITNPSKGVILIRSDRLIGSEILNILLRKIVHGGYKFFVIGKNDIFCCNSGGFVEEVSYTEIAGIVKT